MLLAHGMNSTQNKFGDYAPAHSGLAPALKKYPFSTHSVPVAVLRLWPLMNNIAVKAASENNKNGLDDISVDATAGTN